MKITLTVGSDTSDRIKSYRFDTAKVAVRFADWSDAEIDGRLKQAVHRLWPIPYTARSRAEVAVLLAELAHRGRAQPTMHFQVG